MQETEEVVDLRNLELDPDLTFASGQVFRWRPFSNSEWIGVISGNLITVSKSCAKLLASFENGNQNFAKVISKYFSVDDNLGEIFSSFPKDDGLIQQTLSQFKGLRILTQDPWECLISFVCSINSNIPSIKRKVDNLSRRYGEQIIVGGNQRFFSFPTPEKLASAEKRDLLDCKVGFRWRYIKKIAQKVRDGELVLAEISKMPYRRAADGLISKTSGNTFGVGPKVADCVLLYSLHKLDAFPVDVWMMRCIRENYYSLVKDFPRTLTPKTYSLISDSMRNYFGRFSGYAQLLLYEKIRNGRLTRNREPA